MAEPFVLAAGETIHDDLYITAQTIVIDGTIDGDLIASSETMTINGTVTGDVFALGNELVINGRVDDDVRFGGAVLRVRGTVDGDVLAGNYGIVLAPEATIGGDLVTGGYSVDLAGTVQGDVLAAGRGVQVGGLIAGDARISVAAADDSLVDPMVFNPQMPAIDVVPAGLSFGSRARIDGDLRYEADRQLTLASGLVGGVTQFDRYVIPTADAEPVSATDAALSQGWHAAQRWLLTLLVGALLLAVARPAFSGTARKLQEMPVSAAGWGALWYFGAILFFLVGVTAVILLAILFGVARFGTVAGALAGVGLSTLAVLLVLYVIVLLFVVKAIVGYWLGGLLVRTTAHPFVALAVGTLIVHVLIALPYVGPLLNFIVALIGLGAIWLMWRKRPAQIVEKQPVEPVEPAIAA